MRSGPLQRCVMRKLVRILGRGIKVFLWIVKGLLLMATVGVMVLWPVSCARWMQVSVERLDVRPEWGQVHIASAWVTNGRIFAGGEMERVTFNSEVLIIGLPPE